MCTELWEVWYKSQAGRAAIPPLHQFGPMNVVSRWNLGLDKENFWTEACGLIEFHCSCCR
jgi:hypothetical protein